MRPDAQSEGAELPEDMARQIRLDLRIERRMGNPLNYKSRAFHNEIDCHQTALRAIGMGDSARNLFRFPNERFKTFQSLDETTSYIRDAVGKKMGLAQIKGSAEMIWHSFLTGVDELGRIICFERGTGEDSSFYVVLFEDIYKSYESYAEREMYGVIMFPIYWAVGPVDEIKQSSLTQTAKIKK